MSLLLLLLLTVQPKVLIAPQALSLTPGDVIAVSATLLTEEGEELKPEDVEWEVIPRGLGVVEKGIFRAVTPGIGVLKARIVYKNRIWVGNAYIEVTPKPELRIVIRPRRAKLNPGEEMLFRIEPPLEVNEWKIVPEWLGEIKDGLFRAGKKKGAGKVIAIVKREGTKVLATSHIVIGEPEEFELKVRIDPSFVVLTQNEKIKFQYSIENETSENLRTTWSVEPPFIGEIKEDGTLKITAPQGRGAVWLLVERGDKVGLGRAIVIIAPPGERPEININPSFLVLNPGGSFSLEIQIKDIPPPRARRRRPRLFWRVEPSELGFIRGRGPKVTFEAGREPGSGDVILQYGKVGLEFAVPVLVGINRLDISPIDVTLYPGDTIKFNLKGQEELLRRIKWFVKPVNGGEIKEDGVFIPTGNVTKVYIMAMLPKELGGGGAIALVKVLRRDR